MKLLAPNAEPSMSRVSRSGSDTAFSRRTKRARRCEGARWPGFATVAMLGVAVSTPAKS